MEDAAKQILLTWGPLSIGWLVAAFFLWRAFHGDGGRDTSEAIKAYRDIIDSYREDMMHTRENMAALTVKVETMWDFLMRRAKSEIVMKGLGEMNSPLVITPEAKAMISQALAAQLVELFKREQPKTDNDFAFLIERDLGEMILHDVCIPNGLALGACLIIAMEVAKDCTVAAEAASVNGTLNGGHSDDMANDS